MSTTDPSPEQPRPDEQAPPIDPPANPPTDDPGAAKRKPKSAPREGQDQDDE